MKFDAGTRTRLIATMTLDFDPTGSTVEVKVDSTWHPASWQDAAVQSGGKWTQAARSTGYFAGPEATADGATVLAAGRHATQTRVTSGTDVIVADSTPIDVS
ncbi:hypothetical protein J2X46_002675 [Nocardioides sp. BE266]|uniref:hypothetical protein n=1 Tax=Nocardioides sp. BE266 TaxID=2817725 RepID=UPI002866857A|nr:hypothetical protein [Nocardioides sp. BE266]MDR7253685.1 hypothetical protein [Nocardioides sp. BE266]